MLQRPRRNRKSPFLRELLAETILQPSDFVLPLFVQEGKNKKEEISSMPGYYRLSIDKAVFEVKEAISLDIKSIALFPEIPETKKDKYAKEAQNNDGLLAKAIQEIKSACPDIVLISDVAMDPFSSDGHDGFVKNGKILNDKTLDILSNMAIKQAEWGADILAPSDMMDGRVLAIRKALDASNFTETSILSYAIKYASSFYGPFRGALNSRPRSGDKKTYQMDYRNTKEAKREAILDIDEAADIIMIKPALSYLDIICEIQKLSTVPIAAYNVSGEYAMIKAAGKLGYLNEQEVMLEILYSIKRSGASIIFSYFSKEIAKVLSK